MIGRMEFNFPNNKYRWSDNSNIYNFSTFTLQCINNGFEYTAIRIAGSDDDEISHAVSLPHIVLWYLMQIEEPQ